MKFELKKTINVEDTEKNNYVMEHFQFNENTMLEDISIEFDLPEKWNVGLIVGESGSGKTQLARKMFDNYVYNNIEYDNTKTVIDNFDESVEKTIEYFNKLGFGASKNWLKTYDALSTGEKQRVDLVKSIIDSDMIVFDEFTSVVDRDVAKVIARNIDKVIKKEDKQFVGVTCHRDIIEYMEPDWIIDMEKGDIFLQETFEDNSNSQYIKSKKMSKETYGKSLKNITI